MKTKKIILTIALMIMIFMVLTAGTSSCGMESNTVDSVQAVQQEQMLQDMNSQIGLPSIKEWSEKKMMKEILELRDNSKLITYAYLQNLNGKMVFLGQCIGYGLPYSTQYTNPERIASEHSYGYAILPQADPNGLFSAQGVSATWVQYINPDTGKREVLYCEPNIIVSQSKLPKRLCEEWSLPKDY